MHKMIVLVLFLLLAATPHAHAQDLQDLMSDLESSYSSAADSADDADISASSATGGASDVSTVDANGNMTVNTNEDYLTAIDLKTGSLTIGTDASAKSIRVRSGNVTLKSNTDVDSVTVDAGSLTIGENVTINGNVIVGGKLTAGDNLDIMGSVSVKSSETITLGSNSDITGTLTSPAGLRIGSNGDIKLFLSGKTTEIDGKVYKLGGTILASGANTSVGLPFVPKPKIGGVATTTTATSASQEITTQTTSSEPDSDVEQNLTADAVAEAMNSALLPDITNIVNESDISAYISEVLSSDSNVANMDSSAEEVSLDYKTPASLFGFIPVTVPAHIKVSKDKTVDVSYPWYSFLMSTNKQAVQDAVLQTVSNSTESSDTSAGFSAKLQATITNSILSAFKNLF